MVNKSWRIAMACSIALAFMSCENQKFNDTFVDSERVHVEHPINRITKSTGLRSPVCSSSSPWFHVLDSGRNRSCLSLGS